MHRRGVALLITLVMLSVLVSLVAVGLHINEKFSKDDATLRLMAQVQRSMLDTKVILDSTLADINSSEIFELLFLQPIVIAQEGIEIRYSFSPIDNTINLNKLTEKPYHNLFERILLELGVIDPSFLMGLILDTLDADTIERLPGSERILEQSHFRNGKLYHWEQFEDLLAFYAYERDDVRVYDIVWEKYVNVDAKSIDINFASLELLKFLLPTRSIDRNFKERNYQSLDDLGVDAEQIKNLKALDVGVSTQRVLVHFVYNDFISSGGATFVYDIPTKQKSRLKYFFN